MDREPQRNSLDAYWMPFTANRAFKSNPRLFTSTEGMYFKTSEFAGHIIENMDAAVLSASR